MSERKKDFRGIEEKENQQIKLTVKQYTPLVCDKTWTTGVDPDNQIGELFKGVRNKSARGLYQNQEWQLQSGVLCDFWHVAFFGPGNTQLIRDFKIMHQSSFISRPLILHFYWCFSSCSLRLKTQLKDNMAQTVTTLLSLTLFGKKRQERNGGDNF